MAPELTNINVPATESEAETPPRAPFKRRHCVFAAPPAISYKECMRNHAAGIGGHAVDGCCEFMPLPELDSSGDLRCAACGCHRNFHRRDPDDPAPLQRAPASDSAPPATRSFYSGHHVSLKKTFSPVKTSPPAGISSPAASSPVNGGRKRFRTRFSQVQKEKMFEFAEKLGWKLQRIDKRLIDQFCDEIGVEKAVLKVWMHNNKNTLGRRESCVNGRIIDGEYKIAAGDRQAEKLAGNGGAHNGGGFKPVSVGSGDGSRSCSSSG